MCIFNFLLNWQKHTSSTENILPILKKRQRNLDSTKVIPNIFHKCNLAFKLFLLVIAICYFAALCCFIGITSKHTGYKQMTEIVSLKCSVNISKEHVRKGLADIDLESVSVHKKKTIKKKERMKQMAHLMCSILIETINWKGLVSSFAGVLMDLVKSWFWLFVWTTNKDPLVAANFYIKSITNLGRAPNTLRMDVGTENF